MALGAAELTKFTAVCFYVIWLLLWVICIFVLRRSRNVNASICSLPITLGYMVTLFVTSVAVINCGYAFNGSFIPLGDYLFVSTLLRSGPQDTRATGNRFANTWLSAIPIPLPMDYVQGIDLQRLDFEKERNTSYLAGEIRQRGWWYYYLYGFMVKVPVGTIILLAWAALLALCRWSQTISSMDTIFLWLPPLTIGAFVSSQTGFSHHFRYVLAVFPFLFVAMAGVGCPLSTTRWHIRGPICALLLWSSISSLLVFPHSLSYFNDIVGGPANGHKHMINSNLDWGQDLWFLRDWVEKHPVCGLCPWRTTTISTIGT